MVSMGSKKTFFNKSNMPFIDHSEQNIERSVRRK